MNIEWNELSREDLYKDKIYDELLNIQDSEQRRIEEQNMYKRARDFRNATEVRNFFEKYKKEKEKARKKLEKKEKQKPKEFIINFGKNAEIENMKAIGYYKDSNNYIRTSNNSELVTATLLQPIAILKNAETGEELVKCAFLNRNKWEKFIINKETILNTRKITKLANKGVDVTSESSKLLIGYIRNLLINNEIPQLQSTSKMGWHGDNFLPYDKEIEFDGEESFRDSFNSLKTKGDYNVWKNMVYKVRSNNNVPLKLVMATSFASPLLHLLHRQSFVTLIWGKTGTAKTVAGRIAMSIWGNNEKGHLMFTMDSTINFYYRTAIFFNHIPVFFDELQTFKGDMNKLIMNLTENIDRGKAKIDGGTEKAGTWNNTFIFTGEDSASDVNSGGGTLNRLIEIYVNNKIVENGMDICNILNENYGFAGKIFVDYVKTIDKKKLNEMFNEKYDELMKFDMTEEKQAINMAILLLADEIACKCIFTEEIPLQAEDVLKYMFAKDEIDIVERAYQVFLDECAINKNKFSEYSSERWGVMTETEIIIISKKLRDILQKNNYNYNKILKGWAEKGYIEKNSFGRYSTSMSVNGLKGNYIKIKIEK